jgi:hypothetical protein
MSGSTAFWEELARGDLATWIQLTPYAYATLEGVHLVGVAFFFGAVVLLDLRLLGAMRQLEAGAAGRFLLRISVPAFVLLAASGALLFVPSADRYASSPVFLLKLGAITGGGVNALAFHLATRQGAGGWEQRSRHTPWNVRTAAVVSVLLWIAVISLGRWMGYERRDPPPADIELPLFDAALPTELRD